MREAFLEKIERQKAELLELREAFGEDQARAAVVSKLKRYGLTVVAYCALWRSQGSACAICRASASGRRDGTWQWHVDHDHMCCAGTTGDGRMRRVCGQCTRGILCISCNLRLGKDVSRTKEESEYLEKYVQGRLKSSNV